MVKELRLGERGRDLPKTTGLGCQESRLDIRFAQAVSSGECVLQTRLWWNKYPLAYDSIPVYERLASHSQPGGRFGSESGQLGIRVPSSRVAGQL